MIFNFILKAFVTMRRRGLFSLFALVLMAKEARGETCTRPTDPAGFAGYRYDATTPAFFDTASVRVWYVKEGNHAVRPASQRADGVPDDVARVGEVTEDALQRYRAMGFRAPLSDADTSCGSNGGDGRLDVYLVHFASADGTTIAERCNTSGAAPTCASFVLAEANFEGRYPTVDEGIRTVLPHEAFHTIQNAYDAALDRFWAEGTAQWAAKTLDPSLHDLERFLPSFFEAERRSIDLPPGGVTAGYLYGAAIWPVFLTQRFDTAIVREILEEEASTGDAAFDAARAVVEKRRGVMDDEWSLFWRWNASTGARADGAGYTDAKLYPMLATHDLVDVVSSVTSGSTGYVYRVSPSARVTVALESQGAHRAYLVPVAGGKALLAKAAALPAEADGEALVVLTSLSTSKVDAPYTLRVSRAPSDPVPDPPSPPASSPPTTTPTERGDAIGGGCSSTPTRAPDGGIPYAVAAMSLWLVRRRRRTTSPSWGSAIDDPAEKGKRYRDGVRPNG